MPTLQTVGLSKHFDGLVAVDDICLTLDPGTKVGIAGPNGSGKTTFLNMVSGAISITSGRVYLRGRDVTSLSPDQISQARVSRSFQNLRLWPELTVMENVRIGQYKLRHGHRGLSRAERAGLREAVEWMIESFGLSDVAYRQVSGLAYGMQKRVELARALVSDPILLLLDEPFAGMHGDEAAELLTLALGLGGEERTVVVIEHNVRVLVDFMDRLVILDEGRLLADGDPADVIGRDDVREAYLGPAWDEDEMEGTSHVA